MSKETPANTMSEKSRDIEAPTDEPTKRKQKKKLPIIISVVAGVLIIACVGFWVWHEQPSFCNSICHTPMNSYYDTYDQDYNTAGTDKWGNEVSNTRSMLAVSHKLTGSTCLDCHTPQLSEQVSEGMNWITGNYAYPLDERSLENLTEARGISSQEFCLNESCHDITRDDLVELTSDMALNPHAEYHGETECSDCHKAHRASANYCSDCHSNAEIPDGWLTMAESKKLTMAA